MGNVVNVVKGGSTVPLKFNVYDCNNVERTSVSDIMFQSVQVGEYTCGRIINEVPLEDVPNTGATTLRYDTTTTNSSRTGRHQTQKTNATWSE